MRKQLLPVGLITVLTFVVWLFAEAESLTQVQTTARLRFASFGEPVELLADAQGFDEILTVTLRGSRGAIQRARTLLENAVVIRPGDTGVPDVDGVHVVSVRQALEAYEPFARTGAVLETVRPTSVEVRVDEIVEADVPVVPELPGIVTQGDVTVTPPRARLRAPRRLITGLDDLTLTARVDPDAVHSATAGPRTQSVTLELPDALGDRRGVTLLTERVTVAFTLRSTIETRVLPPVPVQVLLTTASARSWEIEIDEQQQLLPVTLTGPGESLDQVAGPGARLVAVLALSDIELARGDTEKPVTLQLLRDDVPVPIPEEVSLAEDLPAVRFTSRRIDDGESEE